MKQVKLPSYETIQRSIKSKWPGKAPTLAQPCDEVLNAEIHAIDAKADALVGLALSGGGIRSATFNLGVLQGLARARLLNRFDYLSTVSGGGYIGGWLTAWLARSITARGPQDAATDPDAASRQPASPSHRRIAATKIEAWQIFRDSLAAVEEELSTLPDPLPVRNVRDYSNFLTPTRGVFSLDTWSWIALYVASVLINTAVLFTFVAVCVGAVWLVVGAWYVLHTDGIALRKPIQVATLFLSMASLGLMGHAFARVDQPRAQADASGKVARWLSSWLPIILANLGFASIVVWLPKWTVGVSTVGVPGDWHAAIQHPLVKLVIVGATGASAAWTFGFWLGTRAARTRPTRLSLAWSAATMIIATALTLAILTIVISSQGPWLWVDQQHPNVGRMIVFGQVLVSTVTSLGLTVHLFLNARAYAAPHQEWWARMAAKNAACTATVSVVLAVVFVAPKIADPRGWTTSWWLLGLWAVEIGTLLLIGAAGVIIRRVRPVLGERILSTTRIAAVFGVVVLAVAGAETSLNHLRTLAENFDLGSLSKMWSGDLGLSLALSVAALVIALAFSFRGVINLFSLNSAYRLRIARAFLGASNLPGSDPYARNAVTGYEASDDIVLRQLAYDVGGGSNADSSATAEGSTLVVARPYPLINTAINLSGSSDLNWKRRRAGSFIFSPLYCGYELRESGAEKARKAYVRTDEYMTAKGGAFLGTALAISGAATSPNMGERTSTVLAFLMTIANVRLGRWCPNPGRGCNGEVDPSSDLFYILCELMGKAGQAQNWIYLSDGGHFENMGVYELVRRRCRLIVAVDCGADPECTFADVVRLIQSCRVDLGAVITIDLRPLHRTGESRRSRAPFVVGTIAYAGETEPREGKLVLLKPSLLDCMPDALEAYAARESRFPQVATTDQWFSEDQFEAYRSLGQWTIEQVLADASAGAVLRGEPEPPEAQGGTTAPRSAAAPPPSAERTSPPGRRA